MFGAFKRLFSKPAEPEKRAVPLAPTQLVKPAASAAPPAPAVAPAKPAGPAALVVAAPTPIPPAAVALPTGGPEGTIHLPLAAIVAGLPPNLASLASSVGSGTFALPLKTALAQLASGAVKISFGELRQGSPSGSFADNSSQDKTVVSLPLPQILASIDPALLGRRSGQRVTAVPESVTSVFGKMHPFSAATVVTPAVSEAPETETPDPAPPPPAAPVSIPMPAAPEPGASAFTRQPTTPTLPKNLPKPPTPVPPTPTLPTLPKLPSSAPLPSSLPKPTPPAPSSLPSLTAKTPTPSVLPFAAPKPPAMPAAPAAPEEYLAVAVSELMGAWPAPVQEEIEKYQLGGASVSLPLSKLEAAMKTGRVAFTWGDLSAWLKPAPPENLTANREASLDLPLKVIAPLFMARRQPAAAQKKVTIAPQIPDLFASAPKAPEAAAASAPAPVAAEPAAAAATAASPAAAATVSALGEIFGQPGKTEWSPQEITQHICSIKGVAGSVLAMSDGLLMAGQLPAPLRTETVAAFMPQIVGRVSQYAGEMQLGGVTCVVVAAGRGHCALYKTGKLYLAVLGHPGEALPDAVLERIAAELAKRNA